LNPQPHVPGLFRKHKDAGKNDDNAGFFMLVRDTVFDIAMFMPLPDTPRYMFLVSGVANPLYAWGLFQKQIDATREEDYINAAPHHSLNTSCMCACFCSMRSSLPRPAAVEKP